VGVETEISVVDLLVAEFSPKPIATPASPAVTHMTARRIEASLSMRRNRRTLEGRIRREV
jgi:hypothetical protein